MSVKERVESDGRAKNRKREGQVVERKASDEVRLNGRRLEKRESVRE